MKIIDEKGKLFGLINIIDLTVLVMVIALVAGVAVKIVIPKVSQGDGGSEMKDVYVTIVCRLAPENAALNLEKGDRLIAKNNFVDGVVESVSYVPGEYVGIDDQGKAVLSEHPIWKDITVVVKGKGNPNNAILMIGAQEMRIGYRIFFKTQKVELSGQIEDIRWAE